MGTKKIQYNGKIYNSTGDLIKSLVNKGGIIRIVITSDKNFTRSIKQYRLYSSNDCFITITKYQAKKYLNNYQIENEAIYEKVKILLNRDKICFGRVIDNLKELKKLENKDNRYLLYHGIIKGLKGAKI